MNDTIIDNETGQQSVTPQQLDGVRTARVLSFFIDYILVAILSIPIFIIVGILGIPTLTLAWLAFPFVLPAVALAYVGFTMGGDKQATVGMVLMGLQVKKLDGGKVDVMLAALHGILFWVLHVSIIVYLVTFFSSRKRLIHDVLLGTYVVRV